VPPCFGFHYQELRKERKGRQGKEREASQGSWGVTRKLLSPGGVSTPACTGHSRPGSASPRASADDRWPNLDRGSCGGGRVTNCPQAPLRRSPAQEGEDPVSGAAPQLTPSTILVECQYSISKVSAVCRYRISISSSISGTAPRSGLQTREEPQYEYYCLLPLSAPST